MQHTFMVTFIGDDRPGLVEQLSSVIEAQGGNWNESRLSKLAGKFAGLILVTLAQDNAEALEAALRELSAAGLSVRVTPATSVTATGAGHGDLSDDSLATGRGVTLTVLGPDRPGIVKEVAHALAQRSINVLEMHSAVESAAMSAEKLFSATVKAIIPQDIQLEELSASLDQIANAMTLEIDLASME